MQNNWQLYLLLTVIVILHACTSPEAPVEQRQVIAPPPMREDLLAINEPPETPEYWIEWGEIRIPLERYANPNVFRGRVEVELSDFLASLDQKLQLFQENRELELELMSVSRPPFYRGSPWWFSYPPFRQSLIDKEVADKVKSGVARGDQWYLSVYSRSDSLKVHSAVIQIYDPFAAYQPEVGVPEEMPEGEVYGFQIINQSGRPPLLRVDTMADDTRHVLDLYRENKGYRVLHVPGFQTRRRLLTDREKLFESRDIRRTELLSEVPNWLSLPEYTDFARQPVSLSWGAMVANPSSPNYELSFFREQLPVEPQLWVGGCRLNVVGFHLIISSWNVKPRLYVASQVGVSALQKTLLKVPPASTVYFDQLVVQPEDGQLYLFPAAFAFNINEEKPYELQITESKGGKPQFEEGRKREWSVHYKSYPLDQLLADLLEVSSSNVLLEGFKEVPYLDVRFSSPYLSREAGRDLILGKLQDLYRFVVDRGQGQSGYVLEVVDSTTLAGFRDQGEARQYHLEQEGGQRRIDYGAITCGELARYLSEELDIRVLDHTDTQKEFYSFQFSFRSLEDIQAQLGSFGLRLRPLDRALEVMVVRY